MFSEVHEDGKEIGREEDKKIGRKEGEKIGEQRGEQSGKQDMLIRLLQARFPDLPEQILETIKQTENISQLDGWFNQALMVQSFDELVFGDEA